MTVDEFRTPALYPRRLSMSLQAVEFVPMARSTYAQSSFLDDRLISAGAPLWVHSDDLDMVSFEPARTVENRLFVFHSAFCCSTLLCRLLDQLESVLTLKEPYIPAQLSNQLLGGPADRYDGSGRWTQEQFEWSWRFADRFLRRVWDPLDAVIVKLTDRANCLIMRYAELPGAKVLFVFGSLESFLRSVLSRPERRRWVRSERLELLAKSGQIDPLLRNIEPDRLSDAEAAACVWVDRALMRLCMEGSAVPGSFMALDGLRLKTEPLAVISEVVSFFGLRGCPDPFVEKGLLRALAYDSKDLGQRFAETRESVPPDDALLREIYSGLLWAADNFPMVSN